MNENDIGRYVELNANLERILIPNRQIINKNLLLIKEGNSYFVGEYRGVVSKKKWYEINKKQYRFNQTIKLSGKIEENYNKEYLSDFTGGNANNQLILDIHFLDGSPNILFSFFSIFLVLLILINIRRFLSWVKM